MTVKLIDVYDETPAGCSPLPALDGIRTGAMGFLYGLLAQRPAHANISHKDMPSLEQHAAFVHSRPYRCWYLIEDEHPGSAAAWVGAIYATHLNEIGIAIDQDHRRRGYAVQALTALTLAHRPLEAIPGKRSGHWLAHVALENDASHALFRLLGFKPISVTYQL